MKLKHVFTAFTFVCCALVGFTACNDEDYAPITLTTVEGTTADIQDNKLHMDAFSEGESFYIIGGSGRYIIENENANIIDYRFNGNTLTFLPKGIGTATVIINDRVGNVLKLIIEVQNPTTSYNVTSVSSKAFGGKMTGDEMEELAKTILKEAVIKEGGDIVFMYTNKERTEGSVTIHPTESGLPVIGTFQQELKYSDNRTPFLKINVRLTDGSQIAWNILNYSTEENVEMALEEDVTATYKVFYPKLEKGMLTYKIIKK